MVQKFTIYLENEDWQAASYVAKKNGLSASGFIRMLLIKSLREYFNKEVENDR